MNTEKRKKSHWLLLQIYSVPSAPFAQNFCRYSNEKIGVPRLPQCLDWTSHDCIWLVPTWRQWRRRTERWWRWWAPWRPGWPGWEGSCGRLANFNRKTILKTSSGFASNFNLFTLTWSYGPPLGGRGVIFVDYHPRNLKTSLSAPSQPTSFSMMVFSSLKSEVHIKKDWAPNKAHS